VRFTIREFKQEDFDRLHAIDQDCFPPGVSYSRKELAYYMKMRGAFTLVAETKAKSAEIAGFIVAQRHPKGMGHVVTVDTVQGHRRDGLGTLLMEQAEERLTTAGCSAIFLETAGDNVAAIKFYKKLGYFILKTIPRYYQNNMDAFLMAKRLDQASSD
jgi:ribosomal-protein-alanine N-acetyltransferase